MFFIKAHVIYQGIPSKIYRQEVEDLKRQLEFVTEERNDLQVSVWFSFTVFQIWILVYRCLNNKLPDSRGKATV